MTIDQFIKHVSPKHRTTVARIRRIVRDAAPEAKEVIAYGSLSWKVGDIIAVINPTKEYVTVAFLRGAEFEDRYGLLEGSGKRQKLLRIRSSDVNTAALQYYVKQAVKLGKS